MTYASKSDLRLISKKISGIVVCPRANASLAEGIPDIEQMMKMNCNVAIGTDNLMINSPDLFREMDFLWKTTMGIHQKRIEPKNILKMATINAGKLLGKKIPAWESWRVLIGIFATSNIVIKTLTKIAKIHRILKITKIAKKNTKIALNCIN